MINILFQSFFNQKNSFFLIKINVTLENAIANNNEKATKNEQLKVGIY